MRMKSIATAIAIAAAFAACKKEEKGGAADPKEATTKPADPTTAEGTKPADPAKPTSQTPPADTASADSITIKAAAPAVGAKWSEEKVQVMTLKINEKGGVTELVREGTEKKQVEVLALTGNVVTKAKVAYDIVEKQTVGGKIQEMPSPVTGKTYVLDASNGKLAITTDAGAKPSADEIVAIEKDEDNFGKPDRMQALLDGKTFKKGETVDFPADQIKGVMGDAGGRTVTKMSLTYTGNEGTDPAFDWVVAFVQEDRGMKIVSEATGKVVVDVASGELLSMTVEGPIEMTGKATATGTMKITGTRTRPQ